MAGDPAVHNFEVFQGSSFDKAIQWKDSDGNQVNVSGYSGARMQIRRDFEPGSDVILLLNTDPAPEGGAGNGRIELGTDVDFNIRLRIAAADTAALPAIPGDYIWVYDLEMVNGTDVRRLLMGQFKVNLEVTR